MSERKEMFWKRINGGVDGPEHNAYYDLRDLIDEVIFDVLTEDQVRLILRRWKKLKKK